MKKRWALTVTAVFFFLVSVSQPVLGQETMPQNNADLKNQVVELQKKVADLEKKVEGNHDENPLSSAIAGLNVSGGVSAGYFYTANAGQGTSDNEFLLSNFLVEISQKDKSSPVGFVAAVGETSTPSILGAPANTNAIDIEYASLTLTPVTGLTAEVGLLQPNAGYENSYTFNNTNTFLGALASQQPYNAYGGRLAYEVKGFQVWGGYFKNRLDNTEYQTAGPIPGETNTPNESWEVGMSGKVMDTDVSVYHYHLESLRSLTGAVIEHTVGNVDLALNVDYWTWDSSMKGAYGDDHSIGGAVYIVPHFGKVSLPVRLEYIHQGKSEIYLDSVNAQEIYAVTVSPTYHILDNAYVRADVGYVNAEGGFTDYDGNTKSDRICVAAELGYMF